MVNISWVRQTYSTLYRVSSEKIFPKSDVVGWVHLTEDSPKLSPLYTNPDRRNSEKLWTHPEGGISGKPEWWQKIRNIFMFLTIYFPNKIPKGIHYNLESFGFNCWLITEDIADLLYEVKLYLYTKLRAYIRLA